MRIIIIIIIFFINIQLLSKADDIRDFEIEGISIGDSLLDHFTEKEIKENISYNYEETNKKFTSASSNTKGDKINRAPIGEGTPSK